MYYKATSIGTGGKQLDNAGSSRQVAFCKTDTHFTDELRFVTYCDVVEFNKWFTRGFGIAILHFFVCLVMSPTINI